jgi:hypothetical protein
MPSATNYTPCSMTLTGSTVGPFSSEGGLMATAISDLTGLRLGF